MHTPVISVLKRLRQEDSYGLILAWISELQEGLSYKERSCKPCPTTTKGGKRQERKRKENGQPLSSSL